MRVFVTTEVVDGKYDNVVLYFVDLGGLLDYLDENRGCGSTIIDEVDSFIVGVVC